MRTSIVVQRHRYGSMRATMSVKITLPIKWCLRGTSRKFPIAISVSDSVRHNRDVYKRQIPYNAVVWSVVDVMQRNGQFNSAQACGTNRKFKGIRPFPTPVESDYDTFACGDVYKRQPQSRDERAYEPMLYVYFHFLL